MKIIFLIVINSLITLTKAQLDLNNVKMIFVTGPTQSQNITYSLPKSINLLNEPNFDKNGKTIFYIHGYSENINAESVTLITKAFRQTRPTINFVLIDWTYYNHGDYVLKVVPNAYSLIEPITAEIKKILDNGLNLNQMHLIGNSIGGQLVGFISRKLQQCNIMVKRITALDPALPGFFPRPPFNHIKKTDAEFVDIIHTNAGLYGIPLSSGTVDIWPNGGKKQPGCPFAIVLSDDSYCSHRRSWRYYSEAIYNPYAFPAVKIDQFSIFSHNKKNLIYMGVDVNMTARGNYFLKTNSKSPFGKGIDGIHFPF